MQAGSSQLRLTGGVSTRALGPSSSIASSEATPVPIPLLSTYAATWLESIDGLVSTRTLDDYTARLKRHVLPRLGERRLDEIGVDDIAALISDLQQRGYAGWTIRSILTALSRLFTHAARRDLVAANPIGRLDRSERPRVPTHERPVLNHDEISRLLAAAAPSHRTLIATAIFTGLRQSEQLGLCWKDVDFGREVIHVRRSLDRRRRDLPPKTPHAVRDVVLMPSLAVALRAHQEASRFPGSDDFVFASKVGTPIHWTSLAPRVLKPALRNAGIQPIRWHDLRHTFASLLIAGGANITFVSRQLGHSSSQVTLGVYAHLLDREEQAQRARDMLEVTLGDVVRDGRAGR